MGLRANVQPITPASYEAAVRGDLESFVPSEDLDGADLDKAWHAIHYLLTGNTEHRFLLTGHEVEEFGGHVEAHSPKDVAALHAHFSSQTTTQIAARFDAHRFNELGIYPDGWDESAASYLADWLERFRAVVQNAASKGYGLAVTLA